jgi:hypothetical protein
MSQPPPDKVRQMAERIAQELADQGKVIEAGWQIYRSFALRDVQSIKELDRLREIWDAGASHLFTTIATMLEPGVMETEADLRRMTKVGDEAQAIDNRLRLKYGPWQGRA